MSTSGTETGGLSPSHARVRTDIHAEIIVELIASGETIAHCARLLGFNRLYIHRWITEDAAFAARMEEARASGFDAIAERARETLRGKGDSTGNVIRDKAIAEFDAKLLAKWHPKRYGERLEVETINRNANMDIPADMAPTDAARAYQDFMKG